MNSLFMRFPGFKTKTLALSYDDGLLCDERLAAILKKNGLKCTFNLNGGFYGGDEADELLSLYKRMPIEKCISVYGDYFEIACHGEYHRYMEQLPYSSAVSEIINDRSILETLFKRHVRGMAYPYGTYNENIKSALRLCGIAYARTTKKSETFDMPDDWLELSPTCKHTDKILPELAEDFLKMKCSGAPAMFLLWGHSIELENNGLWSIMERFSKCMGLRDDIWHAVLIDIYDYTAAYKSLIFSVDMKHVYNPSCRNVFFNYADKNYAIHPGESIWL